MKNNLPQRCLGNSLQVSAMGFGAMGLSEFYGEADDAVSLALLHRVVDVGVTLIDTADMYGRGHNEKLIGQFLNELSVSERQKLTIATKCGIDRSQISGYGRSINNASDYIRKCCDESLVRLNIEQIGLYYIHRVNKEVPIEETMEVLASLVQAGKVAKVGLCEVSPEILTRAHNTFPVDVVQTEYSLWTRDIEDELLPLMKTLNIGLVPYSPLGRGFLTGKYSSVDSFTEGDFRRTNPRFLDENIQANKKLLEVLAPMAEKYGCTMGQIALSWLLGQWESIVPIPGTKREKYLLENVNACFILLEQADLDLLNNLKYKVEIKGERYTPEGMKGIK